MTMATAVEAPCIVDKLEGLITQLQPAELHRQNLSRNLTHDDSRQEMYGL